MPDRRTFAIVGAGLAGAKAAEALRAQGFGGQIVLLGAERHRPYERPPLSKGYLQGGTTLNSVFVHPPEWYAEQHIDLRLDTTVTAVERDRHLLHTADGSRVRYDKLLLATGATARKLTVPGADHTRVHYLRSLDDSDRLRSLIHPGARIVIIGGGWIGLETAAAARIAGADVVVLEHAELPLLQVLGPRIARVFADLHVEHGVDLRCGVTVAAVEFGPDPASTGAVRLADGTRFEADAVIVGVGAAPNSELGRSCGLRVDNGILVDEHLRTSDDDIVAAGDVANAYHPLLRTRIRVEHWANALHQPVVAARTMLGDTVSYDRLPYFYTDQYDLGMEYTGHADPGDTGQVVVRGDLATRTFIAFWLHDRRVVAAMNVNTWGVTEPIRRLIHARDPVERTRLADLDIPLERLA
jgi:3-phenylpropionate/trans-cinnamate dioxygenase ferredoxin reductase component